ncbi:sensor histidine kinase [Dactylosporangium sp. NBC_01737]|uniref:sensor histidine kinase n=1 Tax=Dactylosporangium sp. NBC_01737 TaxID=2975959 RepID=UPI002E12855C|nr:sensor histidine kinase [Dactylosporangium sp. NBC_01737]
MFHPRRWSLARQLLALQTVVISVLMAGGIAGAYLQARRNSLATARETVLAVARTVADDPAVLAALRRPDPAAVLQPLAERIRADTGTTFVVVMSPSGIRYTHPDPAQIGGRFIGHIEGATPTGPVTETFTGTLGRSVRAVVPILDGGEVRGRVGVGILLDTVSRGLRQQFPLLLGAAAIALLLAGAGSWLVGRWMRRQTHDLGPAELARMYEFYDAVLHAVREGLLLLDRQGRLQLANDEARRLLGLDGDPVGRPIGAVGLPEPLAAALAAGHARTDELHLTGDRVLVVNQAPARWDDAELGTVVTLRDHTELQALTGELDSVRGFAEALRAQAHESANRLHTVVSLIELGRAPQALQFASAEIAAAQQLTDQVVGAVREPVLAALLLGKVTQASERGVELLVAEDADVPEGAVAPRDLVTIVGNLLDNAIDAAVAAPPPRWVRIGAAVRDGELVLGISDSGPGLEPADVTQAFRRGWSTKQPAGRGLGLALAGQAVSRNGGTIDVAGSAFTIRLPVPAEAPR